MMRLTLTLLLALGIGPSAFVGAQPAQPPPLARVEVVPAKSARPGASIAVAVRVTPREGIHIYAPPQKEYKPITITMDRTDAARVGKPQFPPAVTRTFEGEALNVYDAPFMITVPVVVARTARGTVALTGAVSYQACDDLVCYRPVTVPVRWDVPVR